jgi:thiamine-monophosphate kinase
MARFCPRLMAGWSRAPTWSAAADVGVKAAAQNLADIAAMGAHPTALLFGLAIPADLAAEWVLEATRGLAAECRRAGALVAGGDVTSADTIMLAITALGSLAGLAPVTRAGARAGDVIALSGPVGQSAAGLAVLQAGGAGPAGQPGHSGLAVLVAAHLRPQPDYPAGPQAAAAGATSDSLPGTAALAAAASGLGTDWRRWALAGGEDHALAATFGSAAVVPAAWTVIGEVRSGAGVLVDSQPWDGTTGWDHFRSPGV